MNFKLNFTQIFELIFDVDSLKKSAIVSVTNLLGQRNYQSNPLAFQRQRAKVLTFGSPCSLFLFYEIDFSLSTRQIID